MRTLLSKIKSPDALKKILSTSSFKNKKTVFTNGVFDLLHHGHVQYLEKAKKLGQVLIVAVNSDASVKRLKGPSRPLNGLKNRMAVLAALESIDFVTWFEEDTPLNLILKFRPKVLVKGGDWTVDKIVGSKEVLSWKGKVKSIPFLEGHSTTNLIKKAQN